MTAVRSLSLILAITAAAATAQQKPAAAPKPAKPAATAAPRGAYDKAAFEAYLRHLFAWGPQIKIDVSDPKPATLPGFQEVSIHASAGQAYQDETFLVSKDGKHFLRGSVYDIAQNPFRADLEKLKADLDPSYGTPGATAVVIMFSDFQCSFCKEEAKIVRTNLEKEFPGKVRVYFKDFPLEQIHPWAKTAAVAGRCISKQNDAAFWGYHDWIFEHQPEITPENLKTKVLEFAGSKNLDMLQLGRCIDNATTLPEVERTLAEGKALGVNSTPTMFVNGRRLVGATQWPSLKQIVEMEIAYQKTARNAGEDCGCDLSIKPGGKN